MSDWSVVNLPSVSKRVVRSYDANGNEIADDGEWHRRVSEMHFVLAEFLAAKSLIATDVDVSRRPDLVIQLSEITEAGKAFVESGVIDRWMGSLDRQKPGTPITSEGLGRLWVKFTRQHLD